MNNVKSEKIPNNEIKELKNLSFLNKSNLMYKKIRFSFDGVEYESIIKGVGQKTIKLELYLDYGRILENKESGILEKLLWDKINTIYH